MTFIDPPWDLYRTLLAVLEHGSLSAAARALGLAQPTVGRQIEALETQLGLPLFTRSQTGLLPTDAARALRPHTEAMRASAAALLRLAQGSADEVRGAVRITAAEMVGIELLPPLLATLREQHAELVLELVLSDQLQNLLQRDADIAVRMSPPTQDALLAQKVGTVGLGLYAHRDYAQRHGLPQRLDELAQHALIGFDTELPYIRRLRERLALPIDRDDFAVRSDNTLAQLALLRAGFGIAFCHHGIAARDPALLPVLAQDFGFGLDTWVLMHEDLRGSRRHRVVFDALAEGLRAHLARP
ncbi:LysR family transcriptional regulator [Chitinolyticbacter meiyuanensis]|uniref:LysR family transcriptional regulator n=1 Tax=Chitinolyticbacter meiyuanensis TaxID=682798 RepID=UPI0011E5F92E|nr:LysR family transcriptional regulator [Chitinolyticbacter meiyuanensis]